MRLRSLQGSFCDVDRFGNAVVRARVVVILVSVVACLFLAAGISRIGFSTDFRIFFGPDNPHLEAYNSLQASYQKADNILLALAPQDGNVFSTATLKAVRDLTKRSWQLPYVTRVDSITNFQHSKAVGDEIRVGPVIPPSAEIDGAEAKRARDIVTGEPSLVGRLVARDGKATAVNLSLTLPERSDEAVPQAMSAARALMADARERYPDIRFALTGTVPLNNAFVEAAQTDLWALYPIVYAVVFLGMLLLFPYPAAIVGSMTVVGLSTIGAAGLGGWLGIDLNPVSAVAPLIVTTVATADIVHLLTGMDAQLRKGAAKRDAIRSALRLNFFPIFLTSITTAIGFLSLNASDAPPFHDLGNITAAGVAIAWLLTITLLPALLAAMPTGRARFLDRVGNFERALSALVIAHPRKILAATGIAAALLAAAIPRIELTDQFVKYFSTAMPFRTDTEFVAENLTGIYQMEFSVDAGAPGAIAEPRYLERLDAFAEWLRAQPEVTHVQSLASTMKRLNRNMHGDDAAYYRLPESRALAAQYLLLFEMSLPQGLDLRRVINIDRSETRLVATMRNITTRETQALAERAEGWLQANFPTSADAEATGPAVMFSHIYQTNIRSMLKGTAIALGLISLCLILALRSFRLGLLSLIPNMIPAILAFGIWSLCVGRVGLAAAVVTAVTLGIIVDNTIHFLAKYRSIRRSEGADAETAVRGTFATVGPAVLSTTVILLFGFVVLSFSSFQANASLGALSAITILVALVADLTILPALLVVAGRRRDRTAAIEEWKSA